MCEQDNDPKCFRNFVCASLWNTSTHWTRVFRSYLCDSHLVLVFLPQFSSCHPLIIWFPFLSVFIPATLRQSVCHSSPFLLHPSRTLFKERISGSSCSRDKALITLPLLGKPPLPDSSEVFRSHIYKTQGLKNNYNNDRSIFHINNIYILWKSRWRCLVHF